MRTALAVMPAAAPLVARHLGAYVELAAGDLVLLTQSLTQRLVAAAVTLLGAMLTLLLGSAWLLAAAWDTQWLGAVFAALMLLFAALTVTGAVIAGRRWRPGMEPFARLRAELDADRKLVHELSPDQTPTADARAAPRERLAHTRRQLSELLTGVDDAPADNVFPRSATMRLLMGGGGQGLAIAAALGIAPPAVRKLLRFVPLSAIAQWLFRRRQPAGNRSTG